MRPANIALVALALAALCIVGAVVLVAINKTVPAELWAIAFAALTGGAGIAVPTVTQPAALPSPQPPTGGSLP